MFYYVLLLMIIIAISIHIINGGGSHTGTTDVSFEYLIKVGNMYLTTMENIYPPFVPDKNLPPATLDDLPGVVFKNGMKPKDIVNDISLYLVYEIVQINKGNYHISQDEMNQICTLFKYEPARYLTGVHYTAVMEDSSSKLLLFGEYHKVQSALMASQDDIILPRNMTAFYLYELDRKFKKLGKTITLFIELRSMNEHYDVQYLDSYNLHSIKSIRDKFEAIKFEAFDLRYDIHVYPNEQYFNDDIFVPAIISEHPMEDKPQYAEFYKKYLSQSATLYAETYKKYINENKFMTTAAHELMRLRSEDKISYEKISEYIHNTTFIFDSWLDFFATYIDFYFLARYCRKKPQFGIIYAGVVHSKHISQLLTKIFKMNITNEQEVMSSEVNKHDQSLAIVEKDLFFNLN